MNIVQSLRYQLDALKIASNTLDLHVLAISDAFEGTASSAQQELDRQTKLLDGIDADLAMIARVKVHPEFLSAAARKADRTLGHYVDSNKMAGVFQSCKATHGKLSLLRTR